MRTRVLAMLLVVAAPACAGARTDRDATHAPSADAPLAVGRAVADRYVARHDAAHLRFSWGPAILLYALAQLAAVSPDRAAVYREYIAAFHRAHRRPRIARPDHCAPALSAAEVPDGVGTLAAAHAYLQSEPRNHLGAIDHLGYGSVAFASSIWIDSLVMYGLAAAVVAEATDDPHLLDFAFAQPRIFAARLQDPRTGLFRHAYFVEREEARPRDEVFWARGNGWAAMAMIDLLERMPPEHRERAALERIFVHLANGLLANRGADDRFTTVIADTTTYAEPSATLLVAYAWAKGARLGVLPRSFADAARASYRAVVRDLDGLRLRGISRATIPARGRRGYANVPRGTDLAWGVGALLLASAELARD